MAYSVDPLYEQPLPDVGRAVWLGVTRARDLPFPSHSFDMVLCSHLLFTYAGELDLRFHITAISEMRRVCRGEVRVYPLVGTESDASPILDATLRYLDHHSIRARIVDVPYHFQKGAGRMLGVASSRPATPPVR